MDHEELNNRIITDYLMEHELKDIQFFQPYQSKKHLVTRVRTLDRNEREVYFVVKQYRDSSAYHREQIYLTGLFSLSCPVPKILASGDGMIIMEDLQGKPMVDFIFDHRDMAFDCLIESLKRLYTGLHRMSISQGMILGDMNLRNFLYDHQNRQIYRIDLENVKQGRIEEDLGEFLAFYISYDPGYTDDKWQGVLGMMKGFSSAFEIPVDRLEKEFRLSQQYLEKRREKNG